MTQPQLPNQAGRTASLQLSLRVQPSKIIIISLTPPTALLLHRATAHRPQGSCGTEVPEDWQKGASGFLLFREQTEEGEQAVVLELVAE